VARTEFGVAIGSILIVAGVLAIPILAPSPTVAPILVPHILPSRTPTPTPTATSTPSADADPGSAAHTAHAAGGPGSIAGNTVHTPPAT
jgi:hypothetical protein